MARPTKKERAASPALNKQNVPTPSIQSTTYFIDLSWDYTSENKVRTTQALNDRKKLGDSCYDGCGTQANIQAEAYEQGLGTMLVLALTLKALGRQSPLTLLVMPRFCALCIVIIIWSPHGTLLASFVHSGATWAA